MAIIEITEEKRFYICAGLSTCLPHALEDVTLWRFHDSQEWARDMLERELKKIVAYAYDMGITTKKALNYRKKVEKMLKEHEERNI